jgi:hypothetical protein
LGLSRGGSILFNNNFEYEVLKEKRDLNANYLALDVVIDKQKHQEKEINQVELV